MGDLRIEGDQLWLRLSKKEKFWSFHRDLRVPLSQIVRVSVAERPYFDLRGWRVTGTAFPGHRAMGTRRHGSGLDFTLINRGMPVVVIDLNASEFEQWMVSVDDAEESASWLAGVAGIAYHRRSQL